MFTRLKQKVKTACLSLLSVACLALAPTTAEAFVAPSVQPAMPGLAAVPSADLPTVAISADLDTATEQGALIVADEDGNLYLAVPVSKNPYNGATVYALSPTGLSWDNGGGNPVAISVSGKYAPVELLPESGWAGANQFAANAVQIDNERQKLTAKVAATSYAVAAAPVVAAVAAKGVIVVGGAYATAGAWTAAQIALRTATYRVATKIGLGLTATHFAIFLGNEEYRNDSMAMDFGSGICAMPMAAAHLATETGRGLKFAGTYLTESVVPRIAALELSTGSRAGFVLNPLTTESTGQLEFEFAKDFGKNSGLVIGRGADLSTPGALGAGEYKLGWFSVQKTSGMEAEWAVNQAKLQNVMKQNLPIRDASPLSDVGGFYLNRERGLLQSSGWNYQNGCWIPPKP